MVDGNDETGKFHGIMGVEFASCTNCAEFVLMNLPGWSFDEYVNYRLGNEADAVHLNHALSIHGRSDQTSSKPMMQPAQMEGGGFEIYEKKAVLNHHQVITEYEKMPTSLRLQPYWMPSQTGKKVIYLCERTEAFKAKYPTCKIYVKSSDEVFMSRMQESHQKALFPMHPQLILQGLGKLREIKDSDGDAKNSNSFMRLGTHVPTHAEVLKRAEFLKQKNTRKFRKENPLMMADQLDSDGECLSDEDNEGGQTSTTMDVDNEGEQTTAGSSSGSVAGTPNMKRTGSAVSVGQGSEKKKVKAESKEVVPVNPHEKGTSEYWIFELRFELAFDGDFLGHPLSQGGILAPKLNEEERSPLNTRMQLTRKAKTIAYNLVADVIDKDNILFMGGFICEAKCDVFW